MHVDNSSMEKLRTILVLTYSHLCDLQMDFKVDSSNGWQPARPFLTSYLCQVIALLPCLILVSAFPSKLNSIGHNNHHSHHDHDEDVAASRNIESYLSPVEYEDEDVSASRVVDSYLIPVEYDEEPAASQAVDSYLVPDEQPAAQEPVRTFAKVT